MREKGEDGVARGKHLEAAAKRGNAFARKELTPPPFPDALAYLYDWTMELHGRSGVTMEGLAPLSYGTIGDWARLHGRHPAPHEIDALFLLDTVLRHPEALAED